MKDRLILVLLVLAALMPAVLAFSVPSASAAPAATASQHAAPAFHATAPAATGQHRTCDERYTYSTGYRGILSNIPYASATWTHNTCTWYLQTKVKYTTSCKNAPYSGPVKGIGVTATSSGTANTVWCSGWVRFHAGGEPWGSWHKMG